MASAVLPHRIGRELPDFPWYICSMSSPGAYGRNSPPLGGRKRCQRCSRALFRPNCTRLTVSYEVADRISPKTARNVLVTRLVVRFLGQWVVVQHRFDDVRANQPHLDRVFWPDRALRPRPCPSRAASGPKPTPELERVDVAVGVLHHTRGGLALGEGFLAVDENPLLQTTPAVVLQHLADGPVVVASTPMRASRSCWRSLWRSMK